MAEKKQTDQARGNESVPKVRKPAAGPLRNKEMTRARMIEAVGKVIQKQGYQSLTAPNIAKAAGVDKRLVWSYFDGPDNLIEEYFRKKDFWRFMAKNYIDNLLKEPEKVGKSDIDNLLEGQFDMLLNDKVLYKIIAWELGEKSKLLRDLADKREEIGEQLFSVIAPEFESKDEDIRARLAVIIGGIYYLSVHSRTNGSNFCGIDLNEEEGKDRVKEMIKKMIGEMYDKAGVKNSKSHSLIYLSHKRFKCIFECSLSQVIKTVSLLSIKH